MKAISGTIFAIGAAAMAYLLLRKFTSGFGAIEMTDAIGLLVLAGAAQLIWGQGAAKPES